MKAIISTTYSDTYLYFIPIVAFCWNKLGVDVICFLPDWQNDETFTDKDHDKLILIDKVNIANGATYESYRFQAPKHKESTYAQCSRLYGACLDLPEDEILITGDVDMAMFKIPTYIDSITIFGSDLVPTGQYPMCYASGTVKEWRSAMKLYQYDNTIPTPKGVKVGSIKTYQQCLDELLGDIDCENMRGNYWGKDQQTLWGNTCDIATTINRAREGTQFASKRYDRDDAYILERLSPYTIDFHMNRPGYEPQNFGIILKILQYHYPDDNFEWLISYTEQYKMLL